MTPTVFDRPLLKQQRRRALAGMAPGVDFLADLAAEDVRERLQAVSRRFRTALVIGPSTDHMVRAVAASGRVERIFRADFLVRGPDGDHPADLLIDDEVLPVAPGSLDLVVSGLTLQWANDLPGALVQIRRALAPDGLFLGTLVGADSLGELREAFLVAESDLSGGTTPRVAPFADLRDVGALLQRTGFALPVIDQDRLTLRYATPFHLMRELKGMGAANALVERSRRPMTPRLLQRAAAVYRERFSDRDGRVRATIAMVSMSGWAPHESQQKPLKPGSARVRLADALGASEVTLKDT